MKKIITLIITTLVMQVYTYAVDEPSDMTVQGPVKQVTTTISLETNNNSSLFYGAQPGGDAKFICWYDSVGRITEKANYINNQVQDGYVCQYTINNTYMEYEYNHNGLIKGSYTYVQSDSIGRPLVTKQYREGKIVYVDSTIYNAQGNKIEYYESRLKTGIIALKNTYEYDSIGRLYKENDLLNETYYTIEYLPNGNYTEHHVNKDGKTWERKYIVNKKGVHVKCETRDMRLVYSRFDQYGNWLQLKSSTNTHTPMGWVTTIIERVIEYYE